MQELRGHGKSELPVVVVVVAGEARETGRWAIGATLEASAQLLGVMERSLSSFGKGRGSLKERKSRW